VVFARTSRTTPRILQNDAQIRYLVEPLLAHCEQAFDTPRQPLH